MKGPPINYLVTLVASKMIVPPTGGHGRNPNYSLKRPLPLSPEMNAQLEEICARVNASGLVQILPMQLAALILEMALDAEQDESITEGRTVIEVPS